MEVLLAQTAAAGAVLRSGVTGRRLIVERDGRVVGMQVLAEGVTRNIRALRGVVLACGGFIHNRQMVQRHAPALFDGSAPWGSAGELGEGIAMGSAVGGETLQMHEGLAITPIYPPESALAGIVVNATAQRFLAEDSYYGVLGDAIAYQQQGQAWLITDASSSFNFPQDNFLPVAEGSTIGEAIHGLFAAGRTVAGLPVAPYIASGFSVGDCTFFGRRAGIAAASEIPS
ncbi:MAG: FAD-binding protein [Haliea sp.]|nr:FAD-binding protein [Haliea sp.]